MLNLSALLSKPKKLDQAIKQALEEHQPLLFRIGRAPENEICLPDAKISRHHARLTQLTPTTFLLEDLDSKHGTWVNGLRIVRKITSVTDEIRFAHTDYALQTLLAPFEGPDRYRINPNDFSVEFSALKTVYEQYPVLRKNCQNRDKLIRTGSVILSSVIGVSAIITSGPGSIPLLQLLSGAGLGVLIPALSSTVLSTDEKIELLDKEYRELYRCPNPDCNDPFGNREWSQLKRQKSCHRCKAVWVK